ncbi:MAG: hypothetical protein V3V15_00905 [Sphingorhabdus sp.]
MTIYTFQRGETISLALDALTGDPLTVSNISAAMKAVAPGRTSAAPDTPVAAAFAIEPRAGDGETAAGWDLSIPAPASSALVPGSYVADARLEMSDGGVIISDPIAISIRPSVSA